MTKHARRVTMRRLRDAVHRLPDLERQVLLLASREDLDNIEVALRLGLEPDEVRALLALALASVDRALEPPARPWWKLWQAVRLRGRRKA